jgi:hypothetical protein
VIVSRLQVESLCLADDVRDLIRLDNARAGKGIVIGDAVGLVAEGLDIDPQQLAEQ